MPDGCATSASIVAVTRPAPSLATPEPRWNSSRAEAVQETLNPLTDTFDAILQTTEDFLLLLRREIS